MARAKVFRSVNSRAFPEELAQKGPGVEIVRRGDEQVIRNKPRVRAFELLAGMPDDFFLDGRSDPPPQKRKEQ